MNNNLYEACLIAQDLWFDSMDLIEGEHEFSKSFERKMNRLIDKMRNDKYHHLTRRATRALIIAAIILALATTVIASPRTREYIIEKFSDHSTYTVEDGYEGEVEDLVVGYIPDGFELTYEVNEFDQVVKEYKKDDFVFSLSKTNTSKNYEFDTEFYDSEIINYDNIDYIYYKDKQGSNGLIWNLSNTSYLISGNIDKDIMIKIAKNLK